MIATPVFFPLGEYTVIVGRVTLLTPITSRPATRNVCPDGSTTSGPLTGCGSGAAEGHIGTCVCPGDGSQPPFCADRLPSANTPHTAKIKDFIRIPRLMDNLITPYRHLRMPRRRLPTTLLRRQTAERKHTAYGKDQRLHQNPSAHG